MKEPKAPTIPEHIIQAFDECLVFIYGDKYTRDNPHKSDVETAQRWIDDGLTFVAAVIVFYKEMSWMHEKFLKWAHSQNREMIPHSLKVFDENIQAAIRRLNSGGQTDEAEKVYSQWRSRCSMWKKKGLWKPDMWGPEPFVAGNRVPKSILKEIEAHR